MEPIRKVKIKSDYPVSLLVHQGQAVGSKERGQSEALEAEPLGENEEGANLRGKGDCPKNHCQSGRMAIRRKEFGEPRSQVNRQTQKEVIGWAGDKEKPGREGGIWGLWGWDQLEGNGRGQKQRRTNPA